MKNQILFTIILVASVLLAYWSATMALSLTGKEGTATAIALVCLYMGFLSCRSVLHKAEAVR